MPIETHEHFIVKGKIKKLKSPILHRNVNDLHDYIRKHNHYSDWNCEVMINSIETELKASLFGNQASRRRFIRLKCEKNSLFPLFVFVYFYFLKLGFLDGGVGLVIAFGNFEGTFYRYIKLFEDQSNWDTPNVNQIKRRK